MYSGGIYLITIKHIFYYGQTKNLRSRKQSHLAALKRGDHINQVLQRAWNKYGEYKFTEVERCCEDDLNRRERFFIERFIKLPNNANMSYPGEDGRAVVSEETREKLRAVHLGKKKSKSHCEAIGRWRRNMPEETRRKLAEARNMPVVMVTPGGFPLMFESVLEASDVIGGDRGNLPKYLRGDLPWPTRRRSKYRNWSGCFLETPNEPLMAAKV